MQNILFLFWWGASSQIDKQRLTYLYIVGYFSGEVDITNK